MLFFQNCAPPSAENTFCAKGKNCGPVTTSGPGTSAEPTTVQLGSNGATSGPGGSGSTYGGSNGSGGGSSGGSSGGGSTGGIGGSGGNGGANGGSTDNTFRIVSQPLSVQAPEFGSFSIEPIVAGGMTPYTFQWSKNGVNLPEPFGGLYFYSDYASRYSKEGNYAVTITDATGARLVSRPIALSIIEQNGACDNANYVMMEGNDLTNSGLLELFDGPRGKNLIHRSNMEVDFVASNASIFHIYSFAFPRKNYLEPHALSCQTYIPRIHSPQANPGGPGSPYYIYTGSVQFECRHQKWKYVTKSCQWIANPNLPPDNGGGN